MGDYYHYDDWATFDPAVKSDGAILKVPSFGSDSLFMQMDVMGALNTAILPVVFALVMTAIFDATGTIRAVAGQANLLDKDGQIINGGRALTSDSVSSLFSGIFWDSTCCGVYRICCRYGSRR